MTTFWRHFITNGGGSVQQPEPSEPDPQEREALDAVYARTFVVLQSSVGSDHQNFVAQEPEMANSLAQACDHAVDFGEKSFGEECDAQVSCQLPVVGCQRQCEQLFSGKSNRPQLSKEA